MDKQPCVYLLASKRNGTRYVGVTSDLIRRTWEHREHLVEGFTKKHKVGTLVRFELHETMESAIRGEKQLKKWNRAWKIRMIETNNPTWRDLYSDLL
jgi:putative endonuclease